MIRTLTQSSALYKAHNRPLAAEERRQLNRNAKLVSSLATVVGRQHRELITVHREIRRLRMELFGAKLLAATLRLAIRDQKTKKKITRNALRTSRNHRPLDE